MTARAYGSKHLSRKSATAALTQLLYYCTDERLQSFTAASLAATHNVDQATAGQMLEAARRARGL